jgi:hypothetical protein
MLFFVGTGKIQPKQVDDCIVLYIDFFIMENVGISCYAGSILIIRSRFMKDNDRYSDAKEQYAAIGVNTDEAISRLKKIPLLAGRRCRRF